MQGGVPRLLFPAHGDERRRPRPSSTGSIETWLKDTFDVDVDFEVDDALGKLDRLGLLTRDGERLSVPPPDETLARLDRLWDNYFQYSGEGAATPRAAEQSV